MGTQLITGSNSKKVKDWIIRSQVPKFRMQLNKEKVQRLDGSRIERLANLNDVLRYSPLLFGNK